MAKKNKQQMTIFDLLKKREHPGFAALNTFPTLDVLVKMHSGIPFYEAMFPRQDVSEITISQIQGLSMVRSGKLGGLRFLTEWKKILCRN